MTQEEFLERIDEIMCGTSNAERAYLADLYDEVTAPHWISVEDELPPKKTGEASDKVLVYDTETNRVGASWYFHSTGKWFNGWDCVTHWMPLPSVEHLKDKEVFIIKLKPQENERH